MQLISTLRSDLSTAMKAQDSAKVKLIRSLLNAIDNASAVPAVDTVDAVGLYAGDAPRRSVEREQVRSILKEQIDERNTAAGLYSGPRSDRKDASRGEDDRGLPRRFPGMSFLSQGRLTLIQL
jgi:uncharacterized protein YqeY